MNFTTSPPVRTRQERDILALQWIHLPKRVLRHLLSVRPAVRQLDFDDAIQVARLGLLRAAELWDSSRGVQFVSYAWRVIARRIAREAWLARVVRPPFNPKLVSQRFRGAVLAAMRSRPRGWLGKTAQAGAGEVSEIVAWQAAPCPITAWNIRRIDAGEIVEKILAAIHPREAEVLRLLFLEDRTQGEAGEILGISRNRVQQIRDRGVERARKFVAAQGWQVETLELEEG